MYSQYRTPKKPLNPLTGHKMKHTLYQTIKRQQSMQHRLHILQLQKIKKIKQIEIQQSKEKKLQQTKRQKSIERQKVQKSFHLDKIQTLNHSNILQEIRFDLSSRVSQKKQEVLKKRHQNYIEIKKKREKNELTIRKNKQKQITLRKTNTSNIKLDLHFSKENIKKYWDQKIDHIQLKKRQQDEKNYEKYVKIITELEDLQKSKNELSSELTNVSSKEKSLGYRTFANGWNNSRQKKHDNFI